MDALRRKNVIVLGGGPRGTRSLILPAGADMIAPPSVGDYMAAHLPNGEFVVMQATGHCPHMSAPAETIAAIRRFVAA